MIERRFRREFRSLEPIVEFVNAFLGPRHVRADQAHDVHLIIEELFTNMVKYSPESHEEIAIGLDWLPPVLTVRLRDFDVNPFDVTKTPPVDVNRPIEERRAGGLGLHFVQQLADGLDYQWADRVSTITVTKRLDVMMFHIQVREGGRVRLAGRLDAAEAERAMAVLAPVDESMTLDCSELEYISSAGIGVIMQTYKRLLKGGHRLTLVQMTPRVRNVFRYAGLDRVLQIE